MTPHYGQYDKVILYAPTFRDHADTLKPFKSEFLERLDSELAGRNWCLLVKKHPYDRGLLLPEHLQNVRDVSKSEKDIQELLVQTEVLITDYSSVFVDFLLRDKPLIFYVYDLDDYQDRSRKMYYELDEVMPGPVTHTEEELLELILTADEWYRTQTSRERRRVAMERFHLHNDGKACLRLEAALASGFCEFGR